jgi:hypothetical protein
MTAVNVVRRVVSALLALALLLGSLLMIAEIVLAALGRAPLLPYSEWTGWLRTHSWNDWRVNVVLGGLFVLGLLFLVLALRRGKPASLALSSGSDGVAATASRRSVEKSLAAAAARTTGIAAATASVSRRTARVNARTVARSGPGVRAEVESAVRGHLDSLGLERPLRTRVNLSTKDS